MTNAPAAVLAIRELSLEFPTYRGAVHALDRVSLRIDAGEIIGLVGESGSGKSVAAMAAIRLLPPQSFVITGGAIAVVGQDLVRLAPAVAASLRGKQVSMVFQEPMSALNPTLKIGRQICDVLRRHENISREDSAARARQLLIEMQVPDPARVMNSHAFELSGGMRQRVLLAMAFACNPRLLIADEPTTALDVTVQAQVLALIRDRARAHGTAVLFISHDLAVVSQLCSRLYVMYGGQIVETGASRAVLRQPQHPYTRALLQSLPERTRPGMPLRVIAGTVPSLVDPPAGCRYRDRCDRAEARCEQSPPWVAAADAGALCWFPGTGGNSTPAPAAAPEPAVQPRHGEAATLLQCRDLHIRFPLGADWRGRPSRWVHAVNGVDLDIRVGETLAVVGESGCGKSTLAQLAMRLAIPTRGQVCFDGTDLGALSSAALRRIRPRFQIVFQDPQASLDPRLPAWQLIGEPLAVARGLRLTEVRRRAADIAALVGIGADQLDRFAHEFSGGQRQRLAIGRALALEPELLVLDEPTSALDVSIQAQILNLLMDLQQRLRLTYLFISHNVAVVRHVADRVAVMYLGQIVEMGPCKSIIEAPRHPYTRQLIGAVPSIDAPFSVPQAAADGPGNLRVPEGCYFRSRCPRSNEGCATAQPLVPLEDGRLIRCHRARETAGGSIP